MGRFRLSKKCRPGKPGARISRSAQRDKVMKAATFSVSHAQCCVSLFRVHRHWHLSLFMFSIQEPRHRASPTRIVSLYPYLTPEQRKLIEDAAGFGGLLQIRCPTFPIGLCGWLLQHFETNNCELVIDGRGRIPVTIDSVHRVLGIPNSGGDVKYCMDGDAIAFMSNKYGYPADGHSPSIKSFENSLKQMKSADEHFLRTFMVLVVSSFLCPTTSLTISRRCFPSLVDIGSIKELNWCKFVVEQLKKFGSAYGRKNSFPGCLFYLVVSGDHSFLLLFEKK
jgi:hypothetical protein